MRHAVAFVMASLLILAPHIILGGTARPTEPTWLTTMRYCDLVVRGEVASSEVTYEKISAVTPIKMEGIPDGMTSVTRIKFRVHEVIWGDNSSDVIDFIATPVTRQNYWVGQETVVSLVWGDDILGGSYWVFSDDGRFVHDRTGWVNQESGTTLDTLDGLRADFERLIPQRVVSQADAIVQGQIKSVHLEDAYGPDSTSARVMVISLRDVEFIAGNDTGAEEVTVKQATSGSYWPSWRDAAPLRNGLSVGKTFCFLLKKLDGSYGVVKGINGVWEVHDDGRLYFAGRTRVKWRASDLRAMKEQP